MLGKEQLNRFLMAVMFLTRIRVPQFLQPHGIDQSNLAGAIVYFPIVGGLIGLSTGVLYLITSNFWPPILALVVSLLFEAALTGAFHEDAVADCCDAFGGGWTRDDVLRIMKDSRVGSYGIVGLGFAIAIRFHCLSIIPMESIVGALCASAAIGRWSTVVLSYLVPPSPSQVGLAKDINASINGKQLILSCFIVAILVLVSGYADPIRTFSGIGIVVIAISLWGMYVSERIGYITGDCLGAGCYLAQIVFLLTLVMR